MGCWDSRSRIYKRVHRASARSTISFGVNSVQWWSLGPLLNHAQRRQWQIWGGQTNPIVSEHSRQMLEGPWARWQTCPFWHRKFNLVFTHLWARGFKDTSTHGMWMTECKYCPIEEKLASLWTVWVPLPPCRLKLWHCLPGLIRCPRNKVQCP